MCIDEIISQISNLQSPMSNEEEYILYPNPNYTPVTDTLLDGTLVALDPLSELWCTQNEKVYDKRPNGLWFKKKVSYWDNFVRHENYHSRYPHVDKCGRTFIVHSVVARAWLGLTPKDFQSDHIDGNYRNFKLSNLRLLPIWMNHRDAGFIRKLRHKKIDPTYYARPYLLRFFKRMAEFKATNPRCRYDHLSHKDLLRLIVEPEFKVES